MELFPRTALEKLREATNGRATFGDWAKLPRDIQQLVLALPNVKSLLSLAQTNRAWNDFVNQEIVWEFLIGRDFGFAPANELILYIPERMLHWIGNDKVEQGKQRIDLWGKPWKRMYFTMAALRRELYRDINDALKWIRNVPDTNYYLSQPSVQDLRTFLLNSLPYRILLKHYKDETGVSYSPELERELVMIRTDKTAINEGAPISMFDIRFMLSVSGIANKESAVALAQSGFPGSLFFYNDEKNNDKMLETSFMYYVREISTNELLREFMRYNLYPQSITREVWQTTYLEQRNRFSSVLGGRRIFHTPLMGTVSRMLPQSEKQWKELFAIIGPITLGLSRLPRGGERNLIVLSCINCQDMPSRYMCGKCMTLSISYCSEQCAKEHWPKHCKECK